MKSYLFPNFITWSAYKSLSFNPHSLFLYLKYMITIDKAVNNFMTLPIIKGQLWIEIPYINHNVPMMTIDKNVYNDTSFTLFFLTLFMAWNSGLNSKSVETIRMYSRGVRLINCIELGIKKFSFLLFVKTWFEPIVFPGSLAVLKSRGEAAPNFLGKNAFGLIQEYCTIEEIASFEGSPRFARQPVYIGFSGQKRIGDFERRKENFLIQII